MKQEKSLLQEEPKHIKKKESDVSKSKKKSKHKHIYEDCLITYDFNVWMKKHNAEEPNYMTHVVSYCTVCGKIGGCSNNIKSLLFVEKETNTGRKYRTILSSEKLREKFKDLSNFLVDDTFTNYIDKNKIFEEEKTNE